MSAIKKSRRILCDLPFDCLKKILSSSSLELRDLVKVGMSSKETNQMNLVSNSTDLKLDFANGYKDLPMFLGVLRKSLVRNQSPEGISLVIKVESHFFPTSLLPSLIESFSVRSLSSLKLKLKPRNSISFNINNASFHELSGLTIKSYARHLDAIEIEWGNLGNPSVSFLQSLHLSKVSLKSNSPYKTLFLSLPSLKHLELRNCLYSGLIAVHLVANDVISIVLTNHVEVPSNEDCGLIIEVNAVTKLFVSGKMYHQVQMGDATVEEAVIHFDNMKIDQLRGILRGLKNATSISIRGVAIYGSRKLTESYCFPRLKRLSLDGSQQIKELERIFPHFT